MDRTSINASAFPVNAANLGGPGAYEADPGMTLRDYFAGQVVPQLFALCAVPAIAAAGILSSNEAIAAHAYELADAMLAERAKVSRTDETKG